MANSIVYDSTTQPMNGANSTITKGGFQAFSFSTGASPGTLADVQVELFELSADTGSITAYLYSNSGASNTLGTQITTLGTVSDASLNNGPGASGLTLADFGGNSSVVLAPNTRYWIKLASTPDSNVSVELASGSGGTGVAGEFMQTQASANGTSASNASFGDSVQGRVTENVVCFVAGTRILTLAGEVAVEALRIGDLVITASGAQRPIRWIGRRAYSGIFAKRNPDVLPVCFGANALGDGLPRRDLWVSPKHAMVLDGVLVPAEALVNGRTITKAERVDGVEYVHVELDSHDVLIAEGAASESYVEDDNRNFFHNVAEARAVQSDAETRYCLPRVEDGFRLEAIRARLALRADALQGVVRTAQVA